MSADLVDAANRTIGEGAFEVGPLAYGLWRFTTSDLADAQELVETALDAGMNLIDTADVYGFDWGGTGFGTVEELLGKVLARAPELRDRMVLATKGGICPPVRYDSSADALRRACDDSLRRLGVEGIDLYQVHRPDLFTHPAETAAALAGLREAGKIREVGASNHTRPRSALSAPRPPAVSSRRWPRSGCTSNAKTSTTSSRRQRERRRHERRPGDQLVLGALR